MLLYPNDTPESMKKQKLFNFCLLQAKGVMVLKQKETMAPVVTGLKRCPAVRQEKLTYIVRDNVEDFYDMNAILKIYARQKC